MRPTDDTAFYRGGWSGGAARSGRTGKPAETFIKPNTSRDTASASPVGSYGGRWASEVWLTWPASGPEDAALARLGLNIELGETRVNRAVLERLGGPRSVVRVLSPGVPNTAQELRLVAREMARVSADRIILVTSKPHSRRVRATWRAARLETALAADEFARRAPVGNASRRSPAY